MRHRPDVAPTAQWLERWLNWLPVSEDREESANCYSFIADILNGQGVSFFSFFTYFRKLKILFQFLVTSFLLNFYYDFSVFFLFVKKLL